MTGLAHMSEFDLPQSAVRFLFPDGVIREHSRLSASDSHLLGGMSAAELRHELPLGADVLVSGYVVFGYHGRDEHRTGLLYPYRGARRAIFVGVQQRAEGYRNPPERAFMGGPSQRASFTATRRIAVAKLALDRFTIIEAMPEQIRRASHPSWWPR